MMQPGNPDQNTQFYLGNTYPNGGGLQYTLPAYQCKNFTYVIFQHFTNEEIKSLRVWVNCLRPHRK